MLELQFDSLHTATECCDDVESEVTCPRRLQHPVTEPECPHFEGSWVGNCPLEGCSTVDCGHGETRNSEKDCSLSASSPTLEVHLQEHGLNPPEDRVCLSSNTERDYCQKEEERRELPVVSTRSLSLCDSSEGAQSETVGILTPAVCGKQAEETDREEAVIRKGQEATKGENRSEQEVEERTAREEENNSRSPDVTSPSGETKSIVMGQTPSSGVSDTSDSEMKDCSQKRENCGSEEMKHENTEHEGLSSGGLLNPPLIDSGDVIDKPQSAAPHLLIEGLREGEPPPDINSLEQNQETAGRDYTTEQHEGFAPETSCHSGNCTEKASSNELDGKGIDEPCGYSIGKADNTADCQTSGNSMKDTQTDRVVYESSSEMIPSPGITHSDLDSATAHSLSGDDDASFRSVGSSTTEIFNLTQDSAAVEDQLQVQIANEFSDKLNTAEINDVKPHECSELSIKGDASKPGSISALMDSNHTGTESESQLSRSLQTLETLNAEGKPTTELSICPAFSESVDAPTFGGDEGESGDGSASHLNAEIEHPASEVTCSVVLEPHPSVVGENEVTDPVGGDHHLTEAAVVASSEESRAGLNVLQQEQDAGSEMTTHRRSADEGFRLSEDLVHKSSSGHFTPDPNNEVSSEPVVEKENPNILDTLDEALRCHNSENQGEFGIILVPHTHIYVTGQ